MEEIKDKSIEKNVVKRRPFAFLDKKTAEPLTEENLYDFVVRKEYRTNQETVFWTVFVSYVVFYFCRNQWNVFGSKIMNDGVISTNEFTTIGLVFAITYGISKFITSPLSDTKSNKWLLSIGLTGAGTLNLVLGLVWTTASFGHVLTAVITSSILMVIIGMIHSFGATPAVRFFYSWFSNKSRRSRIVCWNVSANIGGALATFLIVGSQTLFSSVLSGTKFEYLGYFLLPSIISVIMGLLVLILAKDSPESIGLPNNREYYKMETIGKNIVHKGANADEEDKPFSYFLVKYVFKNPYIWLIAISNLAVYTLRMGLTTWSLKYFNDQYNFGVGGEAKWIYSMLDWGGMFFTLIVGLSANKWLKRFVPITMISIGIATFGILGIWQFSGSKDNANVTLLVTFMLISGFIYIPQCFLPLLVGEFSHYRVVSTASGILGISGYMGDAIMSKVIIGYGLLNVGWSAVFIFLIVLGIIGIAVLIPMFNQRVTK